uniref:Interleukin-12 subunit alpha n=1 Tax=Tetraodon nigroviridis TaxID=99883 RepID=H3C7F9_TETNG
MASVASCVSSSLLLVLLMVTWRASTGAPLSAPSAERCQRGSELFRNLLKNIEKLQENEVLCHGITSRKVLVSSKSDTLLACTPALTQNTNCQIQRNSSFNETECMKNIMMDLDHYAAAFQSYLKAPLRIPEQEVALLPTVEMIQSLREESCSLPEEEGHSSSSSSKEEAAQMWSSDTFSNRQEMCEMMRGFYIRTITINRAVSYISSGEHRK